MWKERRLEASATQCSSAPGGAPRVRFRPSFRVFASLTIAGRAPTLGLAAGLSERHVVLAAGGQATTERRRLVPRK